MDGKSVKFGAVLQDGGRSGFRKYRDICYGNASFARVLRAELVMILCNGTPGALGLWLRSKLYRSMFGAVGRNVVFGRNITLRHTGKIRIGSNVVIDDNCVIDAKGETNAGITIGDGVYIGRNTIVYCKNGDIHIESKVNISSNCQVFSSNRLTIGEDTVIGAYSYFLSGGEYDYRNRDVKFSAQSGMLTKGELRVGANCWIGAGVLVLDGAGIGDHCVIGAGAVVTHPIPADSLAVGVPAKVIRQI